MQFDALSFFSLRFFFHTRGAPGPRTVRSSSKYINTARYPSMFHVNLAKLHHTYAREPVCGRLRVLVCLSNSAIKSVQLVEKVQNQRASTCCLQSISSNQLKKLDNLLLSKYYFSATQRIQLILIQNKRATYVALFPI